MLRVFFVILLMWAVFLLGGCSPHIAAMQATGFIENSLPASGEDVTRNKEKYTGRYPTSNEEISAISKNFGRRKMAISGIEPFSPDLKKISCRMLSIKPPYNQSFEDLIETGFKTELSAADVLGKDANGVKITLKNIELSTFGSSAWHYEIVLSSSNGKSMGVSSEFPFEGSIVGKTACQNAQAALIPSIKALVLKALKTSEIVELLPSE